MSNIQERFKLWATAYRKETQGGTDLIWPSETLVRLLKGSYIPFTDKDYSGKKVIDVGFGTGNNLVFLATLGLELYGIEVDKEICDAVRTKISTLGYSCDLRIGSNSSMPFENNKFDYIVSWNVIHYEDNEEKVQQAIKEYHRVLKPGGRFFISTTGPEHLILKDSTALGGHRYRIGKEDDFRKGQVFYYFDTPENIQYHFSKLFRNVMVGRTHDFLMTDILDWFIITGIK